MSGFSTQAMSVVHLEVIPLLLEDFGGANRPARHRRHSGGEMLPAGIYSGNKLVGLAAVYLGTLCRLIRGSRIGVAGHA